jgi:hypothetical protein
MKCYNGIMSVRLRIILCALIYTNTQAQAQAQSAFCPFFSKASNSGGTQA